MGKSVSFTGHRIAPFSFDSAKGHELMERLENAIRTAISEGFDTFYTGMAMGFDIIAAEAVIRQRDKLSPHVRLHCIVPYKGQESKWNRLWRKRYDDVLIAADDEEIRPLNDEYVLGCYQERNRLLVERADMLICFYSGKAGGTRHTVGLAVEKGMEIVNIWED